MGQINILFKKRIFVTIALLIMLSSMFSQFSYTVITITQSKPNEYRSNKTEKILYDNTSDTWLIETIDNLGMVGWYSSIDIFESHIYISYYSIDNGDLRLNSRIENEWSMETIDSLSNVGMFSALTIDQEENIHISYYDKTNGNLKYATNTNGEWKKQTIDETGDVGFDTSITIDTNENAHISYYDKTRGCLKHAFQIGNTWNIEIVDDNGDIGTGTSIAIDNSNRIHITYSDNNAHVLWHATKAGSSDWEITLIDEECYVFASTSLDLDSNGNPHLCYFDVPSYSQEWKLKYATKDSDDWIIEIIDPTIKYFWNEWGCSLKVDDYDRIHVGYYAWKRWNLNYALRTHDRWQIEVVEEYGSVGGYAALAVDSEGYPHMTYLESNDFCLKYAEKIQYAPTPPLSPEGNRIGRTGVTYQYQTTSEDFDGDHISYGWDWGEETEIEWTSYQPSGTMISANHSWQDKGTYLIQVIAKDINGHISPWSQKQEISMPLVTRLSPSPLTQFLKQLFNQW